MKKNLNPKDWKAVRFIGGDEIPLVVKSATISKNKKIKIVVEPNDQKITVTFSEPVTRHVRFINIKNPTTK
jgi:hypothetical protein